MGKLVTLVLLVVLVLAGCGGDDARTGSGPTEAQDADLAGAREARSIPRYSGHYSTKLEPGEYVADRFDPPVRLTLGRGWATAFGVEQSQDIIGLQRTRDVTLYLTGSGRIFQPRARSVADTQDAPRDVAGFLMRHPQLDAHPRGTTKAAGVDARVIDATLKRLSPYRPAECDSPCLPVFDTGSGLSVNLRRDLRARFWLFTPAGTPVVATLQAPDGRFTAAARAAAAVLRTLRFDAG